MSTTNRDFYAKSFAYHGQAVGFAASLTKPSCEIIPSLATASLSITGGESYSTVRDYNWKGLITFDEASAYATGSSEPGKDKDGKDCIVFNTLSTVTLKNLNVANMVHAGLVVARVSSKHVAPIPDRNEKPEIRMKRPAPESQITFRGSMIENLIIAGHRVPVELDEKFDDFPTYEKLAANLKNMRPTGQMWADPNGDVVSCSLAKRVGGKEEFKYAVPGFGTIYVAQVIAKTSYRRISMLRFELGCPIGGSGEAAGGETNGVPYWP